jgi:hypothetical protein
VERHRFLACGFACLFGIAVALPVVAFAQTGDLPKPCTHAKLAESANVRGYVFKAYKDTDGDTPGCVRVYLHGKLAYRLANDEGLTYSLGQPADADNKIPLVPNGSDLTGNGRPDMMVTSWSGGAHCCFTHYIFELEPKLRLIATLNDGDTDFGHFEDLDLTGKYFYVTDEIWSYWPASFAGSVSHKVILKWDKNRFRLDLERMKYRAPTPEQWKSALKDVDDASDDRASLGVTLWDTVLDLIYTGHSELAWKFLMEVNPNALKGNNPSLDDFCSMLKNSEYWPDLEPTLTDVPDECAHAKGRAQK